MRQRRLGVLVALLLACPRPALAQESPTPVATPGATANGRGPSSPRSAVVNFFELADRGDYEGASLYLDLRHIPKKSRAAQREILARQTAAVLERDWPFEVEALSSEPDGEVDDGLAADLDSGGRIDAAGRSVPVTLRHIPEGDGSIWKFSRETVSAMPELYRELGYGRISDLLPPFLSEYRFAGIQLWQWVALILLLPTAYGASYLLAALVIRIGGALARRTRNTADDVLVRRARRPLHWTLAALTFYAGTFGLALTLRARWLTDTAVLIFALVAVTRLGLRLVDVGAALLIARRHAAAAFVPLGRRTFKGLLVAMAVIWGLHMMRFDVTGLLAGLGIGGLAVALASQKTVEHLFGGVTLVADQPVRVGDVCRFGDKLGVVEDIGLRSTRIRTAERTVISIPNGEFSSIQIENLSRRDRTRLSAILNLRYETSPTQLRTVLARLVDLLCAHARIERDSVRVHLIGFGTYSLQLELQAYVLTSDGDLFQDVRQDLFLRIMDVLTECGTGFALPAHMVYTPGVVEAVATPPADGVAAPVRAT